ncbi:MAG: NAD-dependent epimerase/dehydratase family protein [Candidatus Magasanikbacteria bacterium]
MIKTVLLTGGTGFLGSNILKRLISDKYNVILLKRSFSNLSRIEKYINKVLFYNIDRDNLSDIFKQHAVDIVLHCATDYGRKQVSPLQIIEANLILPLRLLELSKENKVFCFINTDTILDKGISHYSLSKQQFNDWLVGYRNSLYCVNVALEHFYGPGDDKTKFVSYIFDCLLNKVDNIDLTPGEQKRDFIYIDDVVDAFMAIINNIPQNTKGFFHYEVGTNNLISIRHLVEMIKELSGNQMTMLNFGVIPYRVNEIMESKSDTAATRFLGWQPKYDIKSGLAKMLLIEKQMRN